MATIQERLNILASTTQEAEEGTSLTQELLEEEKRKASVIDYKMVTFSLAGKDYAIDIMKVKEIEFIFLKIKKDVKKWKKKK